jgi:hypothetical protein
MPIYGGYSPETVFVQLSSAENAVFRCRTPRTGDLLERYASHPTPFTHPPKYHEDVLAMPGDSADLFNPRLFIQVIPQSSSPSRPTTYCQICRLVPLRLRPHRCPRGHRRPSPFTWRPTRPPSWSPPPHQPSHPQTAATPQSYPNEGEIHFEARAITLLLQTIPRRRLSSSAYGPTGAARRLRADT